MEVDSSLDVISGLSGDELAEVLSPKTWASLTDDERKILARLLPNLDNYPPTHAPDAPHVGWIADQNLRFGSPLHNFARALASGAFTPAALAERAAAERAHARACAQHHNDIVHQLQAWKAQGWLPPMPRGGRSDDAPATTSLTATQKAAQARAPSCASSPVPAQAAGPSATSLSPPAAAPAETTSLEGPSLFALVRDAILSVPPSQLVPSEYVLKQVQFQAEVRGLQQALPRGATLPRWVQAAVDFLATAAAGPLVAVDRGLSTLRWVGEGTASSDAALLSLEASVSVRSHLESVCLGGVLWP